MKYLEFFISHGSAPRINVVHQSLYSLDTGKFALEKQEEQEFDGEDDDGSGQRCQEGGDRDTLTFLAGAPGMLEGRPQIIRRHAGLVSNDGTKKTTWKYNR